MFVLTAKLSKPKLIAAGIILIAAVVLAKRALGKHQ